MQKIRLNDSFTFCPVVQSVPIWDDCTLVFETSEGTIVDVNDMKINDKDLSRVEAIIRSMTPAERHNPRIINGSRKRRIAQGSGTRPQDVNRLLKQFSESQKMMKALVSGNSPIPGLSLPGGRRGNKR
ncbi:MAG: hypothetical protein IIB04_04180 [Acidobacteria bacterium]|nr:hypothetical protein [Acidobacteriota bacterium]